jgi:hypothetical protein
LKTLHCMLSTSGLLVVLSALGSPTTHAQEGPFRPSSRVQVLDVLPSPDEDAERVRAETLAGYVIEKVADTATSIPAGTGNFTAFGTPSIHGGTIAFRADGASGQKGVYALIAGTLTKVADLNTPVPGGPGNFTFFSAAAIDGLVSVASDGSVAFLGQFGANRHGIYTNRTGPLSIMVDDTFPVPGNPTGHYENFFSVSHDAGRVAFTGVSDGFVQGLYLANGSTVSRIADTSTPKPGGTGPFVDFGLSSSSGDPSLSGLDVVFTSQGPMNESGVYGRIGGVLTVVADRNTLVPGTTTPFGSFFTAAIRDGDIAFESGGIYVNHGSGLETVADRTTHIPGTLARFTDFGPPALDAGKVVFSGRKIVQPLPFIAYLVKSGVFTDLAGPLQSIVSRSFTARLDGKLVKEVFSGSEAASDGSFTFRVIFFGGGEGIYVARPM